MKDSKRYTEKPKTLIRGDEFEPKTIKMPL